jgi:hypothetical protein
MGRDILDPDNKIEKAEAKDIGIPVSQSRHLHISMIPMRGPSTTSITRTPRRVLSAEANLEDISE